MDFVLGSFQLFLNLSLLHSVSASLGDVFPTFRDCVETCVNAKCDLDGVYFKQPNNEPVLVRLLWQCGDDCKYNCMWDTVNNFENKGWKTPQFHGKWPFIRWLGMQEPASVIFSILNFAVHAYMFRKFTKEVRLDSPMYLVWTVYAVICLNGWIWSAVFHTRDVPFTEAMDYLSAFSMVFYTIYGVGMRALVKKRKLYSYVLTLACLYIFIDYGVYLSGKFDYKYNMMANILVGTVSGVVCILWSLFTWRTLPHNKFLVIVVVLSLLTLMLELTEFTPVFWILDAHALWHLSTVPIPYFFWRFIIEDCKFLRKNSHRF